MINAFVNDFNDSEWYDIFKQKNLKINPIIVIDNFKLKKKIKNIFPETDFIDQRNAIKCLNFQNKKEHKKLYQLKNYEKIGINLLKRYLIFNNLTYNFKKKIFYQTANYWLFEIENKKIDVFLSKTTPHHFYDYIIYYCFKVLKKKTYSLNSINIKNKFYFTNDINDRKIKFDLKNESLNKSLQIASKKYNSVSKLSFAHNMPWYIKKWGNIPYHDYFWYIFYNILKSGLSFLNLKFNNRAPIDYQVYKDNFLYTNTFTKLYKYYLLQVRFCIKKFRLKKIYKKISKKQINNKYVFFAAQFQPEASADPESGIFFSNLTILKKLRSCLPSNYTIVYKEHPNQFHPRSLWDIYRSEKYYKEINKIKNLVFFNENHDSYDLIDNCELVLTLSGNVGFESVARNKRCIVFSKTWYSDFSGIYLAKKLSDIKKYLKFTQKKIDHKLNIKKYSKIINNTVEIKSYLNMQKQIKNDKKNFKKLFLNSIFK